MTDQLTSFTLKVAIVTLAVILCSMVVAMLYGLYDLRVYNEKMALLQFDPVELPNAATFLVCEVNLTHCRNTILHKM